MSQHPTAEPSEDHLLTISEVATFLRTSVKTIRRRIAAGTLPHIRDGRVIRIRASDLQSYLRQRRIIHSYISAINTNNDWLISMSLDQENGLSFNTGVYNEAYS